YTASKHAVVGMARAFAAELGRHNIRVNSLNPGAVATPMGTGRMREALQSAADTYPHLRGMHKPLRPEGIAQPDCHLFVLGKIGVGPCRRTASVAESGASPQA
ncbi:MAG: SDR family oxidoreductase, partial [Mycobacterium sp.]